MSKSNTGLSAAYLPISTLTIPQHWSAEQAMGVWEFLDEVARCVWDRYELQLVELIKAELEPTCSTPTTIYPTSDSAIPGKRR